MKKICKLFIILGVILCIFTIFGCDANESETSFSTEETDGETLESSAADEPGEEILETNTEKPEGNTTESSETEKTDGGITEENNSEETLEGSFVPDEELVKELEYYLYMINADFDMPEELSFSDKIDIIKSGRQALFLKFAPNDCYYVCGYHRNDKNDHYENQDYCCYEEYTWIGFNDEKKIVEHFGDESLAVAFQLNRTEICFDLLPSDKLVPDVEHIKLFTPNFENGANIAESLVYDATYIYLNSSDKNTVYYYYDVVSEEHHKLKTIPCIELEDQYFIIQRIYPIDDSGTGFRLGSSLGEYYDSLMDIMIPGKYSQEDDLGSIQYYGLFEIEAFVNAILKN